MALDPMDLAELLRAANCCRNLVAAVLKQAVVDYYACARARRAWCANNALRHSPDSVHEFVMRATEPGRYFAAPLGNYFSFRGACQLLELDPVRFIQGLRQQESVSELAARARPKFPAAKRPYTRRRRPSVGKNPPRIGG